MVLTRNDIIEMLFALDWDEVESKFKGLSYDKILKTVQDDGFYGIYAHRLANAINKELGLN